MEENWYLITSESILIEPQPAMLVSELITTFDTYSEVTESFYSGSVDVFNSSSVVPTEETLNDPYGIDGPFPEVMDETIT